MAIVYSYPLSTSILSSDMVVGTSTVTAGNGKKKNQTKNFSMGQIAAFVNQQVPPYNAYKVYTATITQSGASAPVATILQNTLGGEITWVYNGVGTYSITSDGLFTQGKTTITCSNLFGNFLIQPFPVFEESSFPDSLLLLNVNTDTNVTENNIDIAFVEIKVYN
jgi:hypothetical protein